MFSELPAYSSAYQNTIDARGEIVRYRSLMQVTIVNDAYVFCFDDPDHPIEIAQIESIDMFMEEGNVTNPGFFPEYAYLDEEKDDDLVRRKQIMFNNTAQYYYVAEQVL